GLVRAAIDHGHTTLPRAASDRDRLCDGGLRVRLDRVGAYSHGAGWRDDHYHFRRDADDTGVGRVYRRSCAAAPARPLHGREQPGVGDGAGPGSRPGNETIRPRSGGAVAFLWSAGFLGGDDHPARGQIAGRRAKVGRRTGLARSETEWWSGGAFSTPTLHYSILI